MNFFKSLSSVENFLTLPHTSNLVLTMSNEIQVSIKIQSNQYS